MKNLYIGLSKDIVNSELWTLPDIYLRVWIFLLATADEDGFVHCPLSVAALACRCTEETIAEVLSRFCAPSPTSRRQNSEGRRLYKSSPAEYLIINFKDIQKECKAESLREYETLRKRIYRAKKVAK